MKKIKEMNIKQKEILFSVTVILIVIIVVIGILVTTTHNKLELKKETVTVEYGNTISTDAKEYLSKDVDKDIIKNTKVTSKVENEKDKTYPAVGSYKVTLTYKDEKAIVKIKVKDTTKPKFNTCDSIEVLKDGTINYGDYVKVEDLSEVKITLEDKEVNLATAGEYTLKATATDSSKNKARKDVKIVVKEVDTVNNDVTVETDEKGNVVLKVTEKVVEQNTDVSTASGSTTTRSSRGHSGATGGYAGGSNSVTGGTSASNTGGSSNQPHVHRGPAVGNMYFNDGDYLDNWAFEYQLSHPGTGCAYGVSECSCGKLYINCFY